MWLKKIYKNLYLEDGNSTTAVDSSTTTVGTTTLPPPDIKTIQENEKKINETLENSLLSSIGKFLRIHCLISWIFVKTLFHVPKVCVSLI